MTTLRPVRTDDAAQIAAIYAPYVTAGTVSFETEPPNAAAMARRMAAGDGHYPWLIATAGPAPDAAVIGYAYAGQFRDRPAYRWAVETTIYIARGEQRSDIGRLLYKSLLATLRAQGFTQAIGAIALPNDASVRLHEAVGFRRAGVLREIGYKDGQWVDVGYWQCDLNDSTVPPAEPRRFADVGLVRA